MPRRTLDSDTYYHVYNRGYNKQTLFYKNHDYERFLNKLIDLKPAYKSLSIKCFCVLPNHFHLLLIDIASENHPGMTISKFMNRLQVAYARYFSERYGSKLNPGLKSPVFEGRFKAKEVLDEAYLSQLVNYIEGNAVKHEIVSDIKHWPYTSWEPGKTFSLEKDFFADFD
ncbi:hypothetical protein GW777_00500 [Candidatus Peregrinibacteria bacterium]|nr:hypothetical protein [Candidatus Peregrinibacteria bacterium]